MRVDVLLSVQTRPLQEGDLDELAWDSERAIHADYIRKTLDERRGDVVFVLAVANGRPIGRIGIDFGLKAAEKIAYLWALGVLPSLRRLGIGTALLREAESVIASSPRGATEIEIGVNQMNHEAAELYRRLGYRDAGIAHGTNGKVFLLLRRAIATRSAL